MPKLPRLPPTHPPGYTSVHYPLSDALKKFSQEMRTGGIWYAIQRLRQMNQLRSGRLVGTDANGNRYYENTNVAYGRTRWVEPKVPMVIFEMDKYYDSSSVAPEWHGWLHYMQDKRGPELKAEFGQAWITHHTQNPSIDRPTHYNPPGHWKNKVPRGRIGPKYEPWSEGGDVGPRVLRNYSDNTPTLHIE